MLPEHISAFFATLCIAFSFLTGAVAAEKDENDGFVIIQPDELVWQPYAGFEGLFVATVYGDPRWEGLYIIRAKFSPGVMSRPHFHSTDRLATVISGTWYAGIGEKFDVDATQPVKAGGFMLHPAGKAHFDGAKEEEVIVEIRGFGPVKTTLIE